ncbi:MAG: hypothetical protein ACNS63_01005 [Candidatus Nitrospinota bacterium M3_3B_026]
MTRRKLSKKTLAATPLEIVDIFYDEARRIASDDKEAVELTNQAVRDFLSHYRLVKDRSKDRDELSDTRLAVG